jgi:hypothetical protein
MPMLLLPLSQSFFSLCGGAISTTAKSGLFYIHKGGILLDFFYLYTLFVTASSAAIQMLGSNPGLLRFWH